MFTDEACFHVLGKIKQHRVRVWGSQNPHVVIEHICDSPKLNVWLGLLHDRLVGLFFFAEDSVTSTIYMNVLEEFAFPQNEDLQPEINFRQDNAPPH